MKHSFFWFLAVLAILAVLAGCEDRKSHIRMPSIPPPSSATQFTPTSSGDAWAGRASYVGGKVKFATAWIIVWAICVIAPALIIFFIPGVIFGKGEMFVEGILLLVVAALLWGFATATGLWWVLVCTVLIPGVVILFWQRENGKIAVFTAGQVAGAVIVLWKGFEPFMNWLLD